MTLLRLAAPIAQLGLWLGAAGCAPTLPPPAPDTPLSVVLLSIDGLRPDAIHPQRTPTLWRLMEQGAYTLRARTTLPSYTLPSHTSMLTGVGPDVHGVAWNEDRVSAVGYVETPTVFDLANARGIESAAVLGKRKLRHLTRPGSLGRLIYPRETLYRLAPEVVAAVESILLFERPRLLFVHLPDPDVLGHAFGWMSGPYLGGVRRADAAAHRLLGAAQRAYGDRFVIIVTADHGGSGRDHGSASDDDVLIPWIAWGAGVRRGEVARPVRTFDTAATVLRLLEIEVPEGLRGRVVEEALGAPTSATARRARPRAERVRGGAAWCRTPQRPLPAWGSGAPPAPRRGG
ncbi:MAG: alkaline phosphatase family protein [Longimicrobiaceae bacterium]